MSSLHLFQPSTFYTVTFNAFNTHLYRDLAKNMDGKDLWETLSLNMESERNETLHNIDDRYGSASLTVDKWKIHKGTNYKGVWDKWYGPAGARSQTAYNAINVVQSPAGRALHRLKLLPSVQHMRQMRVEATVRCISNQTIDPICRPLEKPCLFNIEDDPCEQQNLAEQ